MMPFKVREGLRREVERVVELRDAREAHADDNLHDHRPDMAWYGGITRWLTGCVERAKAALEGDDGVLALRLTYQLEDIEGMYE